MSNNLNDISRIYLDQISNFKKVETEKDVERWTQKEDAKYGYDAKGRSLNPADKAKTEAKLKRREELKLATKVKKESFSNWRMDLAEVIDTPTTDTEDLKTVDVKKGIKNKVVINPKLTEAIDEIGGELIEVTEYDPIEAATDYLYEEGLNEEGIDLLIEELGLEGFVEFIEGSAVELNEERKARRANVKAKPFADVKAEIDKKDAAKKAAKKGEYSDAYARKETDVTVYDDDKPAAKKKAAAKKSPVAKKAATVKKVAKPKGGAIVKAKSSAIVKAVSKVKKTQPAKKATKQGLGDKIRSAYKKGVERHKASVGKAKTEVGKVVKTAKATAKQHSKHRKDFVKGISPTAKEKKIAKGVGGAVKKALTREELELLEKDLNAKERRALPDKDFVFPGKGEGPEGKQRGSYPIPDKSHARNALAMAAAHASPEKEAKVKAAVKKKFPGIKVSEDKAFDNVVGALRKKYGKDAVLTKDSPKPKSKPLNAKQIWRRDDENAVQREIDARYGGAANRKAGRGLGT